MPETNPTLQERAEAKLAGLEALEKAATPGPWRSSYRGDGSGSVYQGADDENFDALLDDANCPYIRGEVRYEDGELSVALRNSSPSLITLVRAQAAYIEALEESYGVYDAQSALDAALREFVESGGGR